MHYPTIYLAGPSSEMARVDHYRGRLATDYGQPPVVPVADWIEAIRRVGESNPADAPQTDRARWALKDLDGVSTAALLWLFRPADGHSSHGAYFEAGTSWGKGTPFIVSGPRTSPSPFDALAVAEFDRDEDAFLWVCRYFGMRSEGTSYPPAKEQS